MEQQTKKPIYKKWWAWVGGVILLFIIIGSVGGGDVSREAGVTGSGDSKTETSRGKQYVEVYTFSGTGQKKSESFNIQGDRFKIAYDCKGDPAATFCGAFVYKVGSNLPQGVMNSTQATKDETIIYTSMAGKGEYYIDANVLGTFTMTVYDYR